MKNVVYLICCVLFLSALITGCKGAKGDKGPTGTQGPAGEPGNSVFIGGDGQGIYLSSIVSLSRTISITVDGPGTIIFTASGYFWDTDTSASYIAQASLSLTDSTIDNQYLSVAEGDSAHAYIPYMVTRGMTVSSAGTYTVYLVGDLTVGSGVSMIKNNATATFTMQ